MDWDVASKTAIKMLLLAIVGAIPGIVLAVIGFAMMASGTADSIFEENNNGLIVVGVLFLIIGYAAIYVAMIAVTLKYFSESVRDLIDPTLSDIGRRVNYVQQAMVRAQESAGQPVQSPTSEPNDPWGRPSNDPRNG